MKKEIVTFIIGVDRPKEEISKEKEYATMINMMSSVGLSTSVGRENPDDRTMKSIAK